MVTAKLLQHGGGQAVRLPRAFRAAPAGLPARSDGVLSASGKVQEFRRVSGLGCLQRTGASPARV